MNTVAVSGNLTRDPELRQTASGTAILSFCVAVNGRRRKANSDEWEDVPNYFDVVMFGHQAEYIAERIAKGSKVAVQGKLHWSAWERDGVKHTKVDITANDVVFMSGAKPPAHAATAPQSVSSLPVYDDDIPF